MVAGGVRQFAIEGEQRNLAGFCEGDIGGVVRRQVVTQLPDPGDEWLMLEASNRHQPEAPHRHGRRRVTVAVHAPQAVGNLEIHDMRSNQISSSNRFGYDFGSTHVHPMANDGEQDFFTITKLEPAPEFPDQRSVLSNSLLIGTMIVQEALNASLLSWRALVYNLIDDLRKFLDKGSDDYKHSVVKVGTLFEQDVRLCEVRGRTPNKKGTV